MSGVLKRHRATDGLSIAWRDHAGAADRLPVVCVPGLTRSSRDFGAIAAHIAPARRVIAVDLRGRGESDHDPDPAGYNPITELADVMSLLDAEGVTRAIMLGTSRGGVIAMLMAVFHTDRLDSAILNDVGPELDPRGLARIMAYVGLTPTPDSWEASARALQTANAEFVKDESPAFWDALARLGWRDDGGRPAPDYDPAIGVAMRAQAEAQAKKIAETGRPAPTLWPQFNALATRPLLTLRGENSDLLSRETLAKMRAAAPQMTVAEVPNRGHVPLLDEPASVAAITAFLEARP